MSKRYALISVSDKTGVVELGWRLVALNIAIFSTGGTAKALRDAGLTVTDVSAYTGFPEMMDGRIKSLHPKIHGGFLALRDNPEHITAMTEHGIVPIDFAFINFYPFQQTIAKPGVTRAEAIENIDIGGPSMLRSAAKNYLWTAPIVNPERYAESIKLLKENDCTIPVKFRLELAGEVFAHTAYYDSLIAGYFQNLNELKFSNKNNNKIKTNRNVVF